VIRLCQNKLIKLKSQYSKTIHKQNKMASRKRALIGSDDDSSSDGEDLEEQLLSLSKKSKKYSPPPKSDSDNDKNNDDDDNSDSSTDLSDDEWTLDSEGSKKKKQLKKKKKAVTKKVERKQVSEDEEEEEEGEIADDDDDDDENDARESSSSSSSEDDGSDEELPAFNDGLDENLMGDASDRLKLEQMTEKEREEELFNRMEKREAMKTRLEIEHKLHAERKREKKLHKKEHKHNKKSDTFDSNDKVDTFSSIASRKSERKRTFEDKKLTAMNELRQKRIEKKERMEAFMQKKEPLKLKDVYSDDEDDDDDKDADDSDRSSIEFGSDDDEGGKIDTNVETKEQLDEIRLSRHKLEQWVHTPFFPRVASGCFVRMGIGNHEGRAIYRVAEIIDVTETPKVYTLGKTRTNKGLKVRHGQQERVFRMEYVSNQGFNDSEFGKWKEEMKLVELPLPTMGHIKLKAEEIKSSKTYNYKEDDVEAIVKEKNRFRKNPHNYAVKKNALMRQKEIAEQTHDYETLTKVKDQMESLEERAQMLDKQRSGALSNVSFINERNRKKNVYDAEKAAVEDYKQNKERKDDPFTRRRTLPKMIAKFGMSNSPKPEGVDNDPDAKNEDSLTADGEVGLADGLSLTSDLMASSTGNNNDTENDEADLFSAHDFDVQIDVAMPESRSISLTPKPMLSQRDNGLSRRSLNLDEYKKRKGLM